MRKEIELLCELGLRRLHHAMVDVGLDLYRKKVAGGNAALQNLPISYFQACALADLGNFFFYASTRVTPDWTADQVIDAMDQIGLFDEKGLGLLSMKDLEPFIPTQSRRKK